MRHDPGGGRRASRFGRLIAIAVLVSSTVGPAWANDVDGILAGFGFDHDQRRAILRGEIVSVERRPSQPHELAAAVAMRLDHPVADVLRRLRDGVGVAADPHLIAWGPLDPSAPELPPEIRYDGDESGEARRLLDARPGSTFNLSSAEVAAIAAWRAEADHLDVVEQGTVVLRRLLAGRFDDYRRRGLGGIAAYDRGGELTSPARDLQRATAAALAGLPSRHPGIDVAFHEETPANDPGVSGRYFWKKSEVEGRPAFIILRALLVAGPETGLYSIREVYVGHTYNALQQIGYVLRHGSGSVLVVENRTTTDRVVGLFGGIARAIGQDRVRDALDGHFDLLRRGMHETFASGG